MKHRVKERSILALVDGRLDAAARRALEEHLGACAECRAFHRAVLAGKGALEALDREPLPPLDWRRVDAALDKKLEAASSRRRGVPTPVLVGALVAAAAAAFVVTWGIATRGPIEGGVEPGEPRAPVKTAEVRPGPGPASPDAVAGPLEAFVTYVAGAAELSGAGGSWAPLTLESELVEGARVRTATGAAAGLQVGTGSACRVEPESVVELAAFDESSVRRDLERGRVTCGGQGERSPLLVSVIEVVASARGSARYSITREGPRVVVIELAEGTLAVRRPGDEEVIEGPARLTLSEENGELTREELSAERAEAVSSAPLGMLARRSIASLHVPAVDGIGRATVDGEDLGDLPLHVRRTPGPAEVLLYPTAGGDPILQEIVVALGPTWVDREDLLAALTPHTPAPRERRVAPRIGTFSDEQVSRLRGLVSGRVRSCYERTLKRYPNTWGRIEVRFTVSTTGESKNVVVSSVAGGHPSVNECVTAALSAERFPPPRGGSVPIAQTITLAPRF